MTGGGVFPGGWVGVGVVGIDVGVDVGAVPHTPVPSVTQDPEQQAAPDPPQVSPPSLQVELPEHAPLPSAIHWPEQQATPDPPQDSPPLLHDDEPPHTRFGIHAPDTQHAPLPPQGIPSTFSPPGQAGVGVGVGSPPHVPLIHEPIPEQQPPPLP